MTEFTINRSQTSDGDGHHVSGNGYTPVGGPEGVARSGEEAPYGSTNERRPLVVEEGDIVDGVAQENGASSGKERGRKRAVGAVLLVFIAVIGLLVAWHFTGGGRTRKASVPVNDGKNGVTEQGRSGEEMTQQAISEASGGRNVNGVKLTDGSVVQAPQSTAAGPATGPGNTGVTQGPPVTSPDISGTVESSQPPSGSKTSDSLSSQSDKQQAESSVSGRNNEHSVRIGEAAVLSVPAGESKRTEPRGASETRDETGGNVDGVAVPPFGSMLPVRSLGLIYTLRSGSLARFELTRDMRGKGWAMRRGTVIVGALRGAELDRAYVALVGFIDPDSGRFVRLAGDMLGADGAGGLRGKRRKMSGSWSRVFNHLGEAGLSIATGLAGSIGNRPVVIGDVYGSYGTRVTDELDGALFNRNKNEFVEVAAGSPGYVMVTELPEQVRGVDALARLSPRDVEERSDVRQVRQTTGISERELAELIQSGDPRPLRRALPRMTPEMRRVAEAVLAAGGGE